MFPTVIFNSLINVFVEKSKDVSSNVIIDTKPPGEQKVATEIKPSKPQPILKKTESSVVQVNPASNKEIKISQETKVSVVEAKPDPPIIVSKVQVVEEVKPSAQVNIISKVEVVTEAPRPVSF